MIGRRQLLAFNVFSGCNLITNYELFIIYVAFSHAYFRC